jgi:hypothetical protein
MLAKLTSALALAITSLALTTGAASAATNVGYSCPVSSDPNPNSVYWDSSGIATTSGVITSWGYDFEPGSGSLSGFEVYLVVLHPGSSPTFWSVVSSATLPLQWSGGSGATRLPIKAGEAIALWSNAAAGAWYCAGTGGTIFGAYPVGTMAPGTTISVAASSTSYRVPIHASIEADVDGDGYGDETQDHCAQSAKFQTCPVANATGKAKAGKSAITLSFANPGETTLSATGKVKIPKTGRHKARTLKFKSKPVAVANGTTGKLILKYPSALKSALTNLSKRKKLKLKVTVTSTGLANTAIKSYVVGLKGRKR